MAKIYFSYLNDETEVQVSTQKVDTTGIVEEFYNFMLAIGHDADNIANALVLADIEESEGEELATCGTKLNGSDD